MHRKRKKERARDKTKKESADKAATERAREMIKRVKRTTESRRDE